MAKMTKRYTEEQLQKSIGLLGEAEAFDFKPLLDYVDAVEAFLCKENEAIRQRRARLETLKEAEAKMLGRLNYLEEWHTRHDAKVLPTAIMLLMMRPFDKVHWKVGNIGVIEGMPERELPSDLSELKREVRMLIENSVSSTKRRRERLEGSRAEKAVS